MSKQFGLIILALFVVGCASAHVYKDVMKEEPPYNSRIFPVTPQAAYQAVERAFLNKNFMLEKEDPQSHFILAKRSLQKGKRTIVLLLQAKITPEGPNQSRVFLSGIETKEINYVADRTRFFLWIVPLPGGGGKEASSVKEGECMVQDKKFYDNMFAVIDKEAAALPSEVIVVEKIEPGEPPAKPLVPMTEPAEGPAPDRPVDPPRPVPPMNPAE